MHPLPWDNIKAVKKKKGLHTLNNDLSLLIILYSDTSYWHLRFKEQKQYQFFK